VRSLLFGLNIFVSFVSVSSQEPRQFVYLSCRKSYVCFSSHAASGDKKLILRYEKLAAISLKFKYRI